MLRKALVLLVLAVGLATLGNPNTAAAQNKFVEATENVGKGFWGLMVRTPEAVVLDVCSAVGNLVSGVAVVFSEMLGVGDRAGGKLLLDGVFSDGLDEIACFAHEGATSAIEIGTRRDFADIPLEREVFIQRQGIFHTKAYKTFPYALKSLGLAALDLATGIPANVCRIIGLTDASDSITKAADSAAENLFGKIQWKYKQD